MCERERAREIERERATDIQTVRQTVKHAQAGSVKITHQRVPSLERHLKRRNAERA